jgi:hypothetical protein
MNRATHRAVAMEKNFPVYLYTTLDLHYINDVY